ncbi:MAG: hypothetical protein JST92_16350, partial [Deltaproteobacteria bacterium]|nr:hypothetical protein [Deltaproteobacteria bacterium]
MLRKSLLGALAIALAATASGCSLSELFDLSRDVEVDEAHGQSVGLVFQMDLAEASELQNPRAGDLSDIALDGVDVTVTQVGTDAGANEVSSLGGEVRLRPAGMPASDADAIIGRFSGLEARQGATAHLAGVPAAGALLLAAHQGDGKFQATMDLDLENGHAAHVVLWI